MAAAQQPPMWPSIVAAAVLSCLLTATLLSSHPALLLGLPRSAVLGAADPLLQYGTATQAATQVTATEWWPPNMQHGVGAALAKQLRDLTAAALPASAFAEGQQGLHTERQQGHRTDEQRHRKLQQQSVDSVMPKADVKVYVYELPPQFNVGVRTNWDCLCCETGLAAVEMRVHRALLNSSRFRTLDPEQADFFYVPFYSECAFIPIEALLKSGDASLEAEKDEKVLSFRGLFGSAMRILREDYPYYNRTAGRDHIFALPLGHGPQRIHSWRWHIRGHPDNYPRRSNGTEVRKTRQELLAATANATGVLVGGTPKLDIPAVTNGTISRHAAGGGYLAAKRVHWQQMLDSVFCLAPEGWHPNSARPFEALAAGCIPVILADEFELPFEDFLNWRDFSVKIPQNRAKDVLSILRNIPQGKPSADYSARNSIEAKRDAMDAHWLAFQYPEPSVPGDAFHYIMAALARKKRRMKDGYLNYWT